MSLCRLIYCSQAAPNVEYYELKDILEKSEKNNAPVGITGMLCFGDSMFLQCLEGNRTVVSQTYHRIANDKRHFDAELIECIEVQERVFQEWSMKVVQLGTLVPEKMRGVLLKYSSSPTFIPSFMTPHQCLKFMLEMQSIFQS